MILACSCAHVSDKGDSSRDPSGIYVTPKAVNRDQHSSAAWLAYGTALFMFGRDQQQPDGFAREVYARTHAAQVWTELKQKEGVKPNSDLDALAAVERSGFMREYVWHYLRRPEWNQAEQLRMAEFLAWQKQHLPSHKPVVDPGVGLTKGK